MEKQRTKQEELERLSRALRTLSGSNRALLRAEDEASLFREICRVVVEEAGYYSAVVSRAEHDESKTVTPLAIVGDELGPPDPRTFVWADTEHGQSATGIAIRTGQPCVISDISATSYPEFWRERARRRGVGSVLSLPLRLEGEVFGALTIAAPEPDAFDAEEKELLVAMAGDLGYGLGALRARARAAAAEETIKRMAYFDSVTGLPNRVRFRDLVAEAIASAKNERRPLALLRVEMDRFREINETLGDREVDKLLQDIALRLQRTVEEAGQVARIAESEFAVVLLSGGAERATQLAQKILAMLCEPIEMSGLLLDARSSIGVSLFPGHGTEADALMRRAGIALNQARQSNAGVALFKGGLDVECAQRCR